LVAQIRGLATFVPGDGVSPRHPPPLFTRVMSGVGRPDP
jgi:hypothetical protein